MLNKNKKSKRFSKRIRSSEYKIKSIEKVRLSKDDILVFSIEGQISEESYIRMSEHIKHITNHEKVLILENGSEVGIIKKG